MKKQIVTTALLLILVLLSVRCTRPVSEPLSAEARHQLNLLPEPLLGVAYLNIHQLAESSFLQSLFASAKVDPFQQPEFQEFIRETGFDPRRDIQEVYLAIAQKPGPSGDHVLAVVRGSFDSQQLLAIAREKTGPGGIASETFENFILYIPPMNNRVRLCFPEDGLLVVGQSSLVKAWLKNYQRGSGPGLPRKIKATIDRLSFKGDLWFAMDPAPLVDQMAENFARRRQDERLEAVRSLQGVGFSALVNKGMRFESLGMFSDPEKAQLFRDAVKGAIAAAKLALSDERKKVDMLNKIKVQLKNRVLRVSFNLDSPGLYLASRIDRRKVQDLLLALRKMTMW